jgi:hypothetical protein
MTGSEVFRRKPHHGYDKTHPVDYRRRGSGDSRCARRVRTTNQERGGYCIGAPYIWNLVKRAPDRVVAAVPAQPVGWNKAHPTYMRDLSLKSWASELMKRNPQITPDMIEKFLNRMFPNPDFLFTVNRDFVRSCQTPMLILLDDTPGHPYDVAWETAMLAPRAELAHYPWKEPKELIPIAVRQIRSFLRAHRPAQS